MNRLLLFAFFCLWLAALPAQKPYNPAKTSAFTLALPKPSQADMPLVAVVDKRFDTSKIGFGLDGSKSKMIYLNGGTAAAVQQYINGNNAGGPPKLLVVLRNLWLQEVKAGELRDADEEFERQNISQCIMRFDVYALEDGYHRALVRIDTTIETRSYLKQAGGSLLAEVLDYAMEKITGLNVKDITVKKTPVRFDDLMRMYGQKMTLPRLAKDTVQRGVYLSYEDFIQNRPTLMDFVLEQDEGGDFLYLNEKDEKRLVTDFWGFCDGHFHFVKIGSNFFPLVRDGNAYSFMGCLQPVHRSQPRSSNRVSRYALFGVLGELHQTRLVKFLRPMQLDMETGKPL